MGGKGNLKLGAPPGDQGKGEGMDKGGLIGGILGRYKPENQKFKVSPRYMRPCLKQNEGERKGGTQECGSPG